MVTEEFGRKVFPYLKTEYFKERVDSALFEIISGYVKQYNNFPSPETVGLELTEYRGIDDIEFEEAKNFLVDVATEESDVTIDWLTDKTEKFCQEMAVDNAIANAALILRDPKLVKQKDGIPQMLQEALAVSFSSNLGHDYLEDWEMRFEHYHDKSIRLPFHLEYLNKITRGGIPPKTLTVILAGTGVGKSMLMCDMAAHHLMDGRNVLYLTLELSEEMVSERIDANLMDQDLSLMHVLKKDAYATKIKQMRSKTKGKLIIEEFPTSGAGAAHFRTLLNELKIKKNFIPDVIYVDYINLCISTRYKGRGDADSYTIVKMVAEELRGLAVDYDVPLITATQTNRGGYTSTDLGLEDTAESFGLPATADLMISITQGDEMKKLGQVRFKQLKNRFNDPQLMEKYDMGVEKSKMRFYELDNAGRISINTEKADRRVPKFSGKEKPRFK